MRRAARTKRLSTTSIPACVGGLNARDSIANMAPTDAIICDNWVPGTSSVVLRKGYMPWLTGMAAPVETLMPYTAANLRELFAASGTGIYNASSAGVVGAPVVTGLTSARFQYVNFGTSGGQFLYAVNGVDSPRLFNGTTWTAITGVSTPAITGVTTTLLKDVQVYARRLWFVEKDSFRVWYLPVDSVGGAASSIDFGSRFPLGGSLQGMVVWTVTSEFGSTDYAAFISSEGEGLLYTGDNPASATDFNLVGTFRIGRPIGQRFYERVGGDSVLICEDGLIPMSKACFTNRATTSDAISYKITNLVSSDIAISKNIFGWQLRLFPGGDKLICNVPNADPAQTTQYVMNTITNQWGRYKGIQSYCWSIFNDEPYFGGVDGVYQGEIGYSDNDTAIMGDIMPAYSYFKSQGTPKLFSTMRPIITANGDFKPSIAPAYDFAGSVAVSFPSLSLGESGPMWDVSPWDITSWGTPIKTSRDWQWLGGIGFAASFRMQSVSKYMSVSWQATDYAWEQGTGLY